LWDFVERGFLATGLLAAAVVLILLLASANARFKSPSQDGLDETESTLPSSRLILKELKGAFFLEQSLLSKKITQYRRPLPITMV